MLASTCSTEGNFAAWAGGPAVINCSTMYSSRASALASWLISATAAVPPRLAMKCRRSISITTPVRGVTCVDWAAIVALPKHHWDPALAGLVRMKADPTDLPAAQEEPHRDSRGWTEGHEPERLGPSLLIEQASDRLRQSRIDQRPRAGRDAGHHRRLLARKVVEGHLERRHLESARSEARPRHQRDRRGHRREHRRDAESERAHRQQEEQA